MAYRTSAVRADQKPKASGLKPCRPELHALVLAPGIQPRQSSLGRRVYIGFAIPRQFATQKSKRKWRLQNKKQAGFARGLAHV
jgi:hypothetical protein